MNQSSAVDRLNKLTAAIPGVVYQFLVRQNGEWQFLYLSPGIGTLFEVTPDEAYADHNALTQCILEEDRASHRDSVAHACDTLSAWKHEHRIRSRSGRIKWVCGQALPERQLDGSILWSGILTDITEHKQTESALLANRKQLTDIIDFLPDATLAIDQDKRVIIWNRAIEKMTGIPTAEMIGRGDHAYDITERKQLEAALHQKATTDDLTGVFNRGHFLVTALAELKRAIRLNRPLAIALIDLDYLKSINDSYGHGAGDQALIILARACQQNLRDIDIFARFGGDEFILLLPEADLRQAHDVLERIRPTLAAHRMDCGGHPVPIAFSAGVASLLADELSEVSLDMLLEQADRALYEAKAGGRNCTRMFQRLQCQPGRMS